MFRWKTRFPSSHSHISRSKIRRLTTPKTDSRAPIPWRGSDDWVRAGNGSQDHQRKIVPAEEVQGHMNRRKGNVIRNVILGLTILPLAVYLVSWAVTSLLANGSIPPASPLPSDEAANRQSILFLEQRTKTDPEDFIAPNKLAS